MKNITNFKIGLIGYGSIGKRHCDNLINIGANNITLFREKGKGNLHGLVEIYDEQAFLERDYDFIILSNPTAFHFSFLEKLIPRNLNLLVEKPLSATKEEYDKLKVLISNYRGIGMCAYNLRFHPCVIKAKEIMDGQILGNIYSSRFFVGQYLPDWHPETDYRTSYSASKKLGGGVVLDLIHEIDLAFFLHGEAKNTLYAITAKVSDLKIETEDLAEILYLSTSNAIVSIHMDYLVRGYSRYFEIIGEKGRLYCDLSKNEIQLVKDKNEIAASFGFSEFKRNDMYLSLIRYYIQCVVEGINPIPKLSDGLVSLNIALKTKSKSNEYE